MNFVTRVREVLSQVRDTVNQNLEDPNSYRSNNNETWIFDHFPKYDGNQKPRIGFYKGPSSLPQQGLGGVNTFEEGDINCGIFVDRKDAYDFDNDGNNEPAEDLLDYLVEKVKLIVENNQDDFTSLGEDVSYVKPNDTANPVRPENQNWIFQQITFEVRID